MAYAFLDSRAIVGRFYQAYEEELGGIWANKVGWLNSDANQETEIYRWLGQVPALREWVGGRLLTQLEKHSFSITSAPYEASIPVNVEDLARDKTGQIMIRVGDLARKTADHWNKLITALITSNGTCYDGLSFFNSNHAIGSSAGVDNLLVAADVPALNVTTANSPTQTEMVRVIIGIIEKMLGYTDDQGEPMNGGARQFAIMVPVNMLGASLAAARSERLDNGQSNLLLAQDFNIEVIPNPRLTTDTELYAFRTDTAVKSFILQEELGPTTQIVGAGSEHEFKNNEHLFGVKAVRAAGYGLFQHAAKATLS